MEYKWEKGQEVIYYSHYRSIGEVKTISKVTPSGRAEIDWSPTYKQVFDKYGRERRGGSPYGRPWIVPATDELLTEMGQEKHRRNVLQKIRDTNFAGLPITVQEKILAIVDEYENSKFRITADAGPESGVTC